MTKRIPAPAMAHRTVNPGDSPDHFESPLIVDAIYGNADMPGDSSIPDFPHPTVVKVTSMGAITRSSNYGSLDPTFVAEPGGDNTIGNVDDGVNHVNHFYFPSSPDSSVTRYVLVAPSGSNHARLGFSRKTYDQTIHDYSDNPQHVVCGRPSQGRPACVTWAGDPRITVERLVSQFKLTVDSAQAVPGSPIVIKAMANPDTVEGQQMPVYVDSARWTPDPDSLGGESSDTTTQCSGWPECHRTMRGAGSMHVVAYVNGKRFEDSVHVGSPVLRITATPKGGKAGDSITFAVSWSDGYAITDAEFWQWIWSPDVVPGTTSPCPYYERPCRRPVMESGTMTAHVKRHLIDRYARVHVVMKKCADVGDPTLDNPDVRKAAFDLMKNSNPDSSAGAGISPTNPTTTGYKKERGLFVYRRPDGTYYTLPAQSDSATSCSFSPNPPTSYPPDSIVALMHTHPSSPGDTVYGKCAALDAAGNPHPVQRYPGDTSGVVGTAGNEIALGGGSVADWGLTASPAWGGNGVSVYTMTKDGDMWRLPAGWNLSNMHDSIPARRKQWKTSACTWP